MNENKIVSALSMAKKAGALVMGFDAVKDTINLRKAKLVVVAADISEGNSRRMKNLSLNNTEIVNILQTKEQLAALSRKPTGIFAITDKNLAILCKNAIKSTNQGEKEC